jgi:hypothetical protein
MALKAMGLSSDYNATGYILMPIYRYKETHLMIRHANIHIL